MKHVEATFFTGHARMLVNMRRVKPGSSCECDTNFDATGLFWLQIILQELSTFHLLQIIRCKFVTYSRKYEPGFIWKYMN